jgi:microcystin-dependent protein
MADDFPIGTVLPFAGSWEESGSKLEAMGWTLCDGSPIAYDTNPDLYSVIGNGFGADETGFRLPDFRGYFLRSVDPDGTMDPDGRSRAAPTKLEQPGNSGLAVGSVQPHGVGPHEHQIINYNQFIQQEISAGSLGVTSSTCPPPDTGGTTTQGNDMGRETRPVNMYVHFIIKVKSGAVAKGASALPGTVIYYTGGTGTPPSGWVPCDGRILDNSYPDLAGVINEYYGANGDNQALVPDYRGVFLRGVDETATIDPDADNRTPPRPDQPTQGNQGAVVGSWQGCSLAPHSHNYTWPPPLQSQCCCCNNLGGCDVMHFSCSCSDWFTTDDGTGSSGVILEVRPRNTYVNHLIAAVSPTQTTPLTIPVGTVIGYAGPVSALADPDWQICEGGWQENASYPALSALIGSTFGADEANGKFLMPWYLGMFLRGVDAGKGVDPDAASRTPPASWAPNQGNTGDNVGSYQGDGVTPHTHQYWYLKENSQEGNVADDPNYPAAVANSSLQPSGSTTGFGDTRPINAYVNFFIKVQ